MNIYYVYFYLRSDYTPYYIGKGKGKRAWTKAKNEIKLPKDKFKIILVEQSLTELQAFILERYYIRWFGRKDNGTGILRNLCDGGEGSSGWVISEAQRNRLSERKKLEYKLNPILNSLENRENSRIRMEHNNPMKKGITNSGSFKKGHKPNTSKETNEKRRISKIGDKNPQYNNPNASKHLNNKKMECSVCGIVTTQGNIARWHNGKCKKLTFIL